MSLRVLIYFAKISGITLDELVGILEPEYEVKSMDNELTMLISILTPDQKRKLSETLKIWLTP